MGSCGWVVFGFLAGLVARALMPGEQKMGLIGTTLLGVAGSFVGGIGWNLIRGYSVFDFHATGFIGSVVGALILLVIGGMMNKRR